jgi:membrane associated rhomboid family serine protease
MESISDAPALVSHGNDLLLKGEVAEAAQDFARATQLDPANAAAHLGVAQANLALGSYGIVSIACRKVLDLAPQSADGLIAQAILYLLDRRYDAALAELERADTLAAGRPYVHAMRGYCLRQMGNSYDAQLAESKAARLAGVRGLNKLFPAVEKPETPPAPAAAPAIAPGSGPGAAGRISYRDQREWNRNSAAQRMMVRTGLASSRTIVTTTLIVLNVALYFVEGILSRDFFNPISQYILVNRGTGAFAGAPNQLFAFGAEQGLLIQHDPVQAYRIVTAMFLHFNITHIAFNMFSLYVIGALNGTEAFFGRWRYLLIYLAAGVAGGLVEAFVQPSEVAIGASGAIFGIFGAFGAILFLLRQRLGPAAGGILAQWVGLIVLNLVIDVAIPGIAIWDHIGGLVVGFALGALFISGGIQRR